MSVTDSAVTDNIVWTQNNRGPIAAGVLSTMSECVTEVESKLKRGTLSASTDPTLTQVQNWLKRAKMEIAEVKGFTFNRKNVTGILTVGGYAYSLPPDYNGGNVIITDLTNERVIPILPEKKFSKLFPSPSVETPGEILVASIMNMEIWFAPPPDSADIILLDYDRSGAETTADDFLWLPEIERYRCCDFALGEAFGSLHMWEQANFYMSRWSRDMAKAMKVDGKRKWQGKRYQAINVFQDYYLMNT